MRAKDTSDCVLRDEDIIAMTATIEHEKSLSHALNVDMAWSSDYQLHVERRAEMCLNLAGEYEVLAHSSGASLTAPCLS